MRNFETDARTLLERLEQESNLRRLNTLRCEGKYVISNGERYINLSSNDYLGLSDVSLQSEFMRTLDGRTDFLMSNPSSRLITGNSPEYEQLESAVSALYGGRAASVLSSGYLANTGVLAAITQKGDLILADKYVHASIIDGLRLCDCEWMRFRHNDMEHLRSLLKRHRHDYRNVWIATESLFSMDGDFAPMHELIELKQEYDLKIYLDEAHAFGVYGAHGEGYAAQMGCCDQIDIIVATLGKAMSSSGAFVVSDTLTRNLLINRMRTLIFSTAMPPINLLWSSFLIERMDSFAHRRAHLQELIYTLTDNRTASQIIPIIVGRNAAAIELSARLKQHGFWATAVRYPTVPQGSARIRVSLSAALGKDDITKFAQLCKTIG